MTTTAVYYRDAEGHEPVNEWINKLPTRVAARVDDTTDLLNGLPDDAPPLAFPHSSQVVGPLRELRCHYGKRHIRILYQRSDNLFVLLHALDKATKKLSDRDIRLAQERMKDFQMRMNADPRTPPRAAGSDAPPSTSRERSGRGP